MGSSQFGDILKSTRKRLGLTIDQATASTRIRGKILEAFEEADFEAMPPKGYSKNMISSYARFLDLDPQDIINMYVKEYEEYEKGRSFDDNPYSYHGASSRVSVPSRNGAQSSGRSGRSSSGTPRRSGTLARKYSTYGADEPVADPMHANVRRISNTRGGNTGGRNGKITKTGRIFSKPGFSGFKGGGGFPANNMRIIIIAVAIVVFIVLAVIIGSFVSSCVKSRQTSDVTPVTNTTANNMSSGTTTGSGTTTTPTTTTSTTPVPFTISFEIAAENYSSMEVVVDGVSAYSSAEATGPMTQSFAVTKSVQMTIGSPDFVIVKKNGNFVDITRSADGIGHVDLQATAAQSTTTTTTGAATGTTTGS